MNVTQKIIKFHLVSGKMEPVEEIAREDDWIALHADRGAKYDKHDEIDLSKLVPLIAKRSGPGNVVPVADIAGNFGLTTNSSQITGITQSRK